MGGGNEIPIFIFIPAIAAIGTRIIKAKKVAPKSNFFILLPPSNIYKSWKKVVENLIPLSS